MNGVHNPFDDIQQAAFTRLRENRHKKEHEQAKQEAFEERQDMINNSISDFNSGAKNETSSFEDQVTDPTKDVGKESTTPADVLEDTHKDTDFNQDEAIKEAEEAVSTPEESRNEAIKDSMNEKLEDKGITVDNVNSELADKHGLDSTKQPNPEAMEAKKEAIRENNKDRSREDAINNPRKAGTITQGTGSQKSQSQSYDRRDDKDRPADLL